MLLCILVLSRSADYELEVKIVKLQMEDSRKTTLKSSGN